jgi:hypothetical protein
MCVWIFFPEWRSWLFQTKQSQFFGRQSEWASVQLTKKEISSEWTWVSVLSDKKGVNSDNTMVWWDRIGMLVFVRQNSDDILADEVTYEDFVRWTDDCISFVWQNGACLTKQWNPHCPITRWKNDYVMTKEEVEERKDYLCWCFAEVNTD